MSKAVEKETTDEKPADDPRFKRFRRVAVAEMRPYEAGESLEGISLSIPDRDAGSPKEGDMIARNPENYKDQWLVAKTYFDLNFEPMA